MKNTILGLFVILFMLTSSNEAISQIVIGEGGYAVIDCSGMAKNAVKTADELAKSKGVGGRLKRHVANDEIGYIGGTHGTTELYINQKVSRKFAVANQSIDKLGNESAHNLITWAEAAGWDLSANYEVTGMAETANTGCVMYKGTSGNDAPGTWRLPTQRELMIIYSVRGQLKVVEPTFVEMPNGTGTLGNLYWTATESTDKKGWNLYFNIGQVSDIYNKDSGENVRTRCVKDLY